MEDPHQIVEAPKAQKSYTCKLCNDNKDYKSSNSLGQHRRTKHKIINKEYHTKISFQACSKCGYQALTKVNADKHPKECAGTQRRKRDNKSKLNTIELEVISEQFPGEQIQKRMKFDQVDELVLNVQHSSAILLLPDLILNTNPIVAPISLEGPIQIISTHKQVGQSDNTMISMAAQQELHQIDRNISSSDHLSGAQQIPAQDYIKQRLMDLYTKYSEQHQLKQQSLLLTNHRDNSGQEVLEEIRQLKVFMDNEQSKLGSQNELALPPPYILRKRSRIALVKVICFNRQYDHIAKSLQLERYCSVFTPSKGYTTMKRKTKAEDELGKAEEEEEQKKRKYTGYKKEWLPEFMNDELIMHNEDEGFTDQTELQQVIDQNEKCDRLVTIDSEEQDIKKEWLAEFMDQIKGVDKVDENDETDEEEAFWSKYDSKQFSVKRCMLHYPLDTEHEQLINWILYTTKHTRIILKSFKKKQCCEQDSPTQRICLTLLQKLRQTIKDRRKFALTCIFERLIAHAPWMKPNASVQDRLIKSVQQPLGYYLNESFSQHAVIGGVKAYTQKELTFTLPVRVFKRDTAYKNKTSPLALLNQMKDLKCHILEVTALLNQLLTVYLTISDQFIPFYNSVVISLERGAIDQSCWLFAKELKCKIDLFPVIRCQGASIKLLVYKHLQYETFSDVDLEIYTKNQIRWGETIRRNPDIKNGIPDIKKALNISIRDAKYLDNMVYFVTSPYYHDVILPALDYNKTCKVYQGLVDVKLRRLKSVFDQEKVKLAFDTTLSVAVPDKRDRRPINERQQDPTTVKVPDTVSLTYSEVITGSFADILLNLQEQNDSYYQINSSSSFLDIGHGTGLCVFQAAFQIGCLSTGIEYANNKYIISNGIKEDYIRMFNDEPLLKLINLIQGDATVMDMSKYTHLYSFNPTWEDKSMDSLIALLNQTPFRVLVWAKGNKYTLDRVKDVTFFKSVKVASVGNQSFTFYIFHKTKVIAENPKREEFIFDVPITTFARRDIKVNQNEGPSVVRCLTEQPAATQEKKQTMLSYFKPVSKH